MLTGNELLASVHFYTEVRVTVMPSHTRWTRVSMCLAIALDSQMHWSYGEYRTAHIMLVITINNYALDT